MWQLTRLNVERHSLFQSQNIDALHSKHSNMQNLCKYCVFDLVLLSLTHYPGCAGYVCIYDCIRVCFQCSRNLSVIRTLPHQIDYGSLIMETLTHSFSCMIGRLLLIYVDFQLYIRLSGHELGHWFMWPFACE